MTDTAIIQARNLTRTYRPTRTTHVTALDNVSCDLRPGTCLAVVGESGSGKSTLARIIVGLDTADSGTVTINGTPVNPTPTRRELRARATQVQMVFQDPQGSLNRSLPVGATIDEMLRTHHPTLTRHQRATRTRELFAEVGLTDRHITATPGALSGGQQQRVAIARALAAEPNIIILDEAVSALDVSVQAQVLTLLTRLQHEHGLSYLFITHDLSVVRHIADDVIVMRHGSIVEHGPVDTLLDHPQHPYTQLLIASAPRPGWTPQRGLRNTLLNTT